MANDNATATAVPHAQAFSAEELRFISEGLDKFTQAAVNFPGFYVENMTFTLAWADDRDCKVGRVHLTSDSAGDIEVEFSPTVYNI